jgi:hypothetical protein
MLQIWEFFSKWVWKILSEANVYVNVTYMSVLLNLSAINVYANVTYSSVLLKVNMKKLECDKCLCKCYIYDCSSQSEYEKSWVRQMFM